MKGGTQVESKLDPMIFAQIAQSWRNNLIIVAVCLYAGDQEFFANMMNIDLERTFSEPGQKVVLRAVY